MELQYIVNISCEITHVLYVLYFRFLNGATLCFADSFANPYPSLHDLHEVDT